MRRPVDIHTTLYRGISLFSLLTVLTFIILHTLAHAEPKNKKTDSSESSGRQKVIDFEESLIEGMGKRPLDSYQQLSMGDESAAGRRLYRIRKSFRSEVQTSLEEKRGLQ